MIMDDRERTLVILLSMHRCGSSLTTQVLQRLGMSLGPFELIGAEPTNPYGHFEAVPFHGLNRRVQSLAFGFSDDLPESPEVLEQFVGTKGRWNPDTYIPDEFLVEGRSLIQTLLDSGRVSGFKDPRTVLTWPFWEKVLASFPDVRVIPLGLIRSPHEIAMSLVTRRSGWLGYWTSLDVIAVHFWRQQQILLSRQARIPSLCFGTPAYLETLEFAVKASGLTWDAAAVVELFDSSAVHQRPAAVAHEAQDLFEAMCGDVATGCDGDTSRARLEKDARFLEGLRLDQWKTKNQNDVETREQAERLSARVGDLESELRDARNRLDEAKDARAELQSQLIDAQERELQAWRGMCHLRDRLARFEGHPVLGVALRGRRRLKRLIHSIGEATTIERNGFH
jgi:hypothetical protein